MAAGVKVSDASELLRDHDSQNDLLLAWDQRDALADLLDRITEWVAATESYDVLSVREAVRAGRVMIAKERLEKVLTRGSL